MAKKILTTAIKQTKIIDKELVSKANNKFFTPPSSFNFDFLPQQENVNAFLNLCLQKCQCKIVFFFQFSLAAKWAFTSLAAKWSFRLLGK